MKDSVKISEAEWLIMNVLWETPELELKQITKKLAYDTDWTGGTVRTMLLRLIDKGAVEVDKTTGVYKYSPRVDRDMCVKAEAKSFLQRIYRGSVSQFVSSLAKDGDISEKERREILEIISSMKDGDRYE